MSKEESQNQPSLKEQQYDQLLAQLRNPDYVRQLAESAGLKVAKSKEETEEQELQAPQPPEIDDQMTAAQVAKVYAKYTQELQQYNEKVLNLRLKKQSDNLRQETTKSKEQEEANKIRKFASSKEDFNKYLSDIDALYATGRYTIEEAYEKAKKIAGVVEKKPEESGKKPEEKKPADDGQTKRKRSSTKEDGIETEELEPAKISVKEVAKNRLTELLKEKKLQMPSGREDVTDLPEDKGKDEKVE